MSSSSILIAAIFFLCLFLPFRCSGFDPLKLPSDEGSLALGGGGGGVCPDSGEVGSCPVKCFRPDPVCGVDNVTYWCGCAEAICAGTRVAKMGFCEVGNGGSGSVSGQALLLVHIVWLILLGFVVSLGIL